MKTRPMLDELWQIKDDLAREAGFDTSRFFECLRHWGSEHPHPGPVVDSAEGLRLLATTQARQRDEPAVMRMNDQPPN